MYFSILSQIIRVDDDILSFRQFIAKQMNQSEDSNNSTSEDPLPPSLIIRAASKDVVPRELPNRFFCVPSPDGGGSKTETNDDQTNEAVINKNATTKKDSDSMSAVSMGTTSSDTVHYYLYMI